MRTFLLLAGLAAASCSSERGAADVRAEDDTPAPTAPAATAADGAVSDAKATDTTAPTPGEGLYALATASLEGEPVDLADYEGRVTLVVNVASRCGYTRQYEGLQALHAELEESGFSVLGFPSNEFGSQEPGTAEEIRDFCTSRFGVTFPMFSKCEVKPGKGQSPVYAYLQGETGEVPGWNFCKYLVDKEGRVLAFYPSNVEPDDAELRAAIEAALS